MRTWMNAAVRLGVMVMCWLGASQAMAASPVDVVSVDLNALIRDAADNPNQFAVNVPHAVTPESAGTWSGSGAQQVWTYAVQVRGAVSLSFHAPRMQLPGSAVLTIRSSSSTTTYRLADAGRGDFWSRVQPGDTLEFRLELAAADRGRLVLQIASFQAGFRGLSPSVPDHPSISRVHAEAAGDPDTLCVTNYACVVTPGNSPPAQATVALLVGNLYQCTGTLINNTAQDNTPYILTARHCQNGRYGGGSPGAASSVTVYWDALTNCGTDLGTVFYVPSSARQTGATTVVEQQDAWLIQLDANPVVNDAQFAGFDASGNPVVGGYSIHHALSYNKQYTGWYGTAYANTQTGLQGSSFASNLLDTINQVGASGPGASGAGLFSSGDRLVGVLSLGRHHDSQSGYGACPTTPLVAPDANNSESSFVSLAAIWNSTADSTSSTGSRTLQSVLDPGSTGAVSVGNMGAARLSFDASQFVAQWGATVTLNWSAANATQCTATGGGGADGWSGGLPGTGARTVTQSSGGDVTYRLRCDLAGGGSIANSLVIHWAPPQSQPHFLMSDVDSWVTRPVTLAWESVIGPCAISGGSLSQTNLPASGSVSTTSNTAADVTYDLTCGPPGFTSTTQHTVSYVTPTLAFAVSGTRRKLGQPLQIAWYSFADSCIPSGGSPGDQWTGAARTDQGKFFITSMDTVGTFDFGLNCISGPLSVQKSIRVTVEDAAPMVTLTPVSNQVTLSYTPSDYIRIRYSTNLSVCEASTGGFAERAIPPVIPPLTLQSLSYTEGEIVVAPRGPGTLNYSVTCLGAPGTLYTPATATASVTVLPPPAPTATISTSAAQVALGTPFTITWSSTNALNCAATGGASERALFWFDNIGASGSHVVQPDSNTVQDARYTISCPSIDPNQPPATASVLVSIGSPGIQLSASTMTPAMGTSFTLSWNEPNATSCTASGGGANGTNWTGTLASTGSATQTASVSGVFTYTLSCVVNGTTRSSFMAITVPAASGSGGVGNTGDGGPSGGTSGGGSSGGGGAIDWLMLCGLLAWSARRMRGA